MKRFLLSIFLFAGVVSLGLGQSNFTATQDGNWNVGTTWGGGCNSGCVVGTDFPGINDDAFTNGFNISVTAPASVRNLFVNDGSTAISFSGPLLTISGTLIGWLGDEFGFSTEITSNVFSGPSQIIFTGSNFNGAFPHGGFIQNAFNNEVIFNWNENTPITVGRFNLTGSSTIDTGFSSGQLQFLQLLLLGGDLSTGFNISGLKIQNVCQIIVGTLSTQVPIYGLTGSNSFTSNLAISNGGTLTLQTNTSYANANNVSIGPNSTLNVGFNGVNQLQGWWYQTFAPANFNLSLSSTINYNANTDQNVFAISQGYGNLIINSSNPAMKTLVGTGNLLVKGNFNIESSSVTFTSTNTNPITLQGNTTNEGNWTTSQRVHFTGTNNQTINGSNPITFNEEFRIDKSSGNVTLQLVNQTINSDLRILQGTFRPLARTVTISGNIINDGTIEATQNGLGGFVFDGTTEISSPGGTGVTQFRNITINNAASLTQELGGEFEITTNFTNNGIFTHNQGQVRFRQSGTKAIGGSSTTTFWDLAAEGGTINVNGTVDLENVMSFAGNPTIDFDGSADNGTFTVKSTAARDAAIANIGSATIQGNAVVERYITGGTGESSYHYMGSPIATDIADWQQEFYVTGGFSDPSSGPGINSNTPSIYVYDELSAGGLNDKWVSYPTTSSAAPIEVGRGYAVSLRDEQGTITANTIGEFHTGQATWNVTDQGGPDDGWNLIANQFPSAIDFDAVGWNKANIENGFYVYDPASGDNLYYSDGVSAATDQYIALGQAFWVRATSNGTVTAQETVKYTGGTPAFYRERSLEKIKIIFEGDEHKDDSYVMFNPEATDAYDPRHDFSNLRNDDHNISTLSTDSKDLKVNHMASLNAESNCGKSIPLFVRSSSTGQFSLKFEELSSIQMSESISLIDHFTDDVINISEGSIYEFDITDDAASKGADRFELSFETKVPVNVESIAMDVCPNDNGTVLLKSTEAFATYLIYKNDGVVSIADGNGGNLEIEIDKEHLSDNLNEFTLKSFIGGCDTVSVGSAQIKVNEALRLNNEVSGSTICKVESRASFSIATQLNANYYILQNQDTLESFTGTGNQFDGFISANNLKNGTNEFVIAVEKDACQSGTLKDKLKIIVENLTIDQDIEFTVSNVCIENPTTINFLSQDNVEYQFYKKEELVATGLGEGTDESIEIPTEFLSVGLNEFNVVAKHGECGEYAFENKIEINVEDSINADLNIVTNNICGVQEVTVIIENAQEEKTYSLLKADQSIMSNTASKNGALTFTLDSSNFELGVNQFDILIEGQNCESVKAFQRVEFGNYNSAVIEEIETQSVCLNESITIDLAANLPMSVYQVFIGDELIMDETGSSIVLSPTETTTYTITGEPESGCESNSINFTVEVTDLAKPGILVSGKVLESSIEGETYQWYLDGDLVADETRKVIVAEKTGNYAVEVSKSNCSILSDTFTFNDEVLSANKELETALKLYPNPVIEKMFVEFDNFSAVEVTIFTLTGKFIDGFRLDSSQSEIDMSKFSKGTYLIQFESEKGSVTKRVIKQ